MGILPDLHDLSYKTLPSSVDSETQTTPLRSHRFAGLSVAVATKGSQTQYTVAVPAGTEGVAH